MLTSLSSYEVNVFQKVFKPKTLSHSQEIIFKSNKHLFRKSITLSNVQTSHLTSNTDKIHIVYVWAVTLCCQVCGYQCFKVICFIQLWNVREEEGSILHRNIRNNLSGYAVSKPRTQNRLLFVRDPPMYSLPFRHPDYNCFPFLVFSFTLYVLLSFSLFAVIIDYPVSTRSTNYEAPLQEFFCNLSFRS